MASLKVLKTRIKSVKATRKITKAMQMVAASKLRRARAKLESSIPYFTHLESMIANVIDSLDLNDLSTNLQKLLNEVDNSKYLVIVTSSDRGLCGSFNANIIKTAKKFISDQEVLGKKCDIITIGNKAYDNLKNIYKNNIVKSFPDITKKPIGFLEAEEIKNFIMDSIHADKYDHVMIAYSHFKSVISQETKVKQLVPFIADDLKSDQNNNLSSYEFEPEPQQLLEALLDKNLTCQIYYTLLENAASEQGARMSTMDNATRNADEMINNLSLVYNRTRQAIITKELIEIISGAEAI